MTDDRQSKFSAGEKIDDISRSGNPVGPGPQIGDAIPIITDISSDTGTDKNDFITKENKLIISGRVDGTLDAGDTIQIRIDEGVWIDVPVSSDGATWIYDNRGNPLANGSHLIEIRVFDKVNGIVNYSTPQEVIIIRNPDMDTPDVPLAMDNVGDIVGEIANGSIIDDDKPVFSGEGLPGGRVIIRDGDKELGKVRVKADGTWQWTPKEPLGEGEHSINVINVDVAGNRSQPGGSLDFTVDTAAPGTKAVIESISPDTGLSDNDFVTSENKLTISAKVDGELRPGDRVEISIDGTWYEAQFNATTGLWEVDHTNVELSEGEHHLSARVVGGNGNYGEETSQDIIIDTVPPSAISSIVDISPDTGLDNNDFITSNKKLFISGRVDGTLEDGDTIQIRIDGGEWINVPISADGVTWVYDNRDNPLANGKHTIETRIADKAGNVTEPSAQEVTIIHNPRMDIPDAPLALDNVGDIVGKIENGSTTDDDRPIFSGAGIPGGRVIIRDGDTVLARVDVDEDGRWEWVPNGPLGGGDHSITVINVDVAGNRSQPSGSLDFTVDTASVPDATITIAGITEDNGVANDDFITNDNTLIISAKVDGELRPGDRVEIGIDGIWYEASFNEATGLWEVDHTNVELSEGEHDLSARIVGANGNSTGLDHQKLIIDNTVTDGNIGLNIDYLEDDVGSVQGKLGSGSTTDDRNPVLHGTLHPAIKLAEDEFIVIYANGSKIPLGRAIIDEQGHWYFDLQGLESNTHYGFTAQIEDIAGNVGMISNDFGVNIRLSIAVDAQTTTNRTPVITGSIGFELLEGEYVEVIVNGKSYSSRDGGVVVDTNNYTWHVKIPDENKLAPATYEVQAVLKNATGDIIIADRSINELIISSAPTADLPAIPGEADTKGSATAVTMDENGNWMIFSNNAIMRGNATSNSDITSFSKQVVISQGKDKVSAGTWMDYNRDGRMDFFGEDDHRADGQQAFLNNGDGTFWAQQVGARHGVNGGITNNNGAANVYANYGGVIAFDKMGFGYTDLAYGDRLPVDARIGGGPDSSFVINHDGTLKGMRNDDNYTDHGGWNSGNARPDKELSGVDLNNDGTVDIVFHGTNHSNTVDPVTYTINKNKSLNTGRLVVASNQGNGSWRTTQIIDDVFEHRTGSSGDGVTMTWADFTGNGYMDLFLGAGSKYTSTATYTWGNGHSMNESRILLNDGHGHLASSNPIGKGDARGIHWMGDNLAGGASLAVDWNHDGKMDVIELPDLKTVFTSLSQINLYTNTTVNGVLSFRTETMANNGYTLKPKGHHVTGAVAIDVDWDGAKDLVVFTSDGKTEFIRNKNEVAYGTSLHFKILDREGINAFYGNTVQLYDSKGKLVGTQIINPQSGNQTNDSTAIVDFFGLDANETYSLLLLRNVAGIAQHIGGRADLGGGKTVIINSAWDGIKAGAANEAHVLTAEGMNDVSNTVDTGIVGTGYNDIFVATFGNKIYNGAGGTTEVSGEKQWSNTGGIDVVDYKLAGDRNLTIDLTFKGAQNTGFNIATFKDIEGIYGANGDDTFTGNSGDNVFNGRGGDDTFFLGKGGHTTLLYELIDDDDATGGNGHDTAYGFIVGNYEVNADADRIDIADLLVGYQADADGPAHYINGKATIDVGDNIADYLQVRQEGNNTILSIDRDGAGGAFGFEDVVTLNGVNADLATLLANHQIIVG